MDQAIIDLYDEYAHVHFNRRIFLDKASKLVGVAGAAAALSALQSNYALAAVVAEDDPSITKERVTFKGATGELKAYLVKPKGDVKRGGVVVVHQFRGLNPHIEDIARRLAKEGFVALAVDFLSPLGGTPSDQDLASKLIDQLHPKDTQADAVAAASYLRNRSDTNGKIGVVGFCWGGGIVNALAVSDPKLTAASVFYGEPPEPKDVPKIKAALLLNYADPKLDTRLGQMVPAYEAALKQAHIPYELFFYPGANHSFNDDTGARYNANAAAIAWSRTLELFRKTLS